MVEAESHCCAFLRMNLDENDGQVTLTIDAPDGAGPILADLIAAFRGEATVTL